MNAIDLVRYKNFDDAKRALEFLEERYPQFKFKIRLHNDEWILSKEVNHED